MAAVMSTSSAEWQLVALPTLQVLTNHFAPPFQSHEHFTQIFSERTGAYNADLTENYQFDKLGDNNSSSGLEDSRSRSLLLIISTVLLIRYLRETIKTGDPVEIGGSVSLMTEFIGYTLEEIGTSKSEEVVENSGKALATAGSIMGFSLDVLNIRNGIKCLGDIKKAGEDTDTVEMCSKSEAIGDIIISFIGIGLEYVESKCPRCVPWTITLELVSLLLNDILQGKFNSDKHLKLSGRKYSEDLLHLFASVFRQVLLDYEKKGTSVLHSLNRSFKKSDVKICSIWELLIN